MSIMMKRLSLFSLVSASLLVGLSSGLAPDAFISSAHGQDSAAAYKSVTRYDIVGRATGTSAPDPDNGDAITVISANVPGAAISGGSTIRFLPSVNSGLYSYVLRDSHGATTTGEITFTKSCNGNFPQF